MTAEMWEEFKFAINPFAGDTKPNPAVTAEQNALSRASSKMMSKVSSKYHLKLYPRCFYIPSTFVISDHSFLAYCELLKGDLFSVDRYAFPI